MDYNTFHNTNIETGLVSDDFDYGRVYIDPVKEFDSKLVPSAYINIAYTEDQLIDIGGSEHYKLLTEKPDDWETNCEKYYYYGVSKYVKVQREYVEVTEFPDDWLDNYKSYYKVKYEPVSGVVNTDGTISAPPWPGDHDSEERNYIYYRYNEQTTSYELIEEQGGPSDWETNYKKYFIKTDKYTLNDNAQFIGGLYYKYVAPTFRDNRYYFYGISQSYFSNYTNSLACIQLTNYVSKTGECALYSDLKFKPDRFYMYQIFVVDQAAPNYDPSKSENPYKFYAGVKYVNVRDELKFDQCWYLGGQNILFEGTTSDTFNLDRSQLIMALGGTSGDDLRFDYNSDGVVDATDLAILQRFIIQYPNYTTNIEKFASYLRERGYPLSYYSSAFKYSAKRLNALLIYSNHQIGNTGQYMCFIQPNLGINEDEYKPCKLQLYNNKCQHELYITNYNGANVYNKDYSIDKLDDSQWLVVLTYPPFNNIDFYTDWREGNLRSDFNHDGIVDDKDRDIYERSSAEIESLIQKPQTKYNIYTNFVNSIPEAYFYYRSNKTLEFEYYDLYTSDLIVLNRDDADNKAKDGNLIIPQRDVIVKCKIYDNNDSSKLKNLVPIKYYKYSIGEVDPKDITKVSRVIYQSDALYDGKYQYAIKGLENYYQIEGNVTNGNAKDNPVLYRIQITAEDEYDQIYEYSEDVYFGYAQEIVTDRISASLDCEKQAAHISFSPVKTFRGEGQVEHIDNNEYVSIKGENGLSYSSLQDDAGNIISLNKNEDFKFIAKFKINDDMFKKAEEHDVLSIITDDDATNYTVKFDTRVYLKNQQTTKWEFNSEYLSFKLYRDNDFDNVVANAKIDCGFIIPNNFEYAFSSSITPNKQGVYFIEESPQTSTVTSLNGGIDNIGGQPDGKYDVPASTTSQIYYIHDNNDADINKNNMNKMTFLLLTLEVNGNNITFNIVKE